MDELIQVNTSALAILKAHRGKLTRQQYRTLWGQVLAGDADGAIKGLGKILRWKHGVKFCSRKEVKNE